MTDKIPVIIDHREDPKVIAMFQQDPDFDVVVDQNDTADYIIGNVAIERKEGDFFPSLGGKKLERQLIELRSAFPRCALVIIGPLSDKIKWSSTPNMTPKQQMAWALGSIAHFAFNLGIPVIMLNDRDEFREFMKHAAKDIKHLVVDGPAPEAPQIRTDDVAAVTFKKKDRSPRAVQRDLLRALAGISAKKANLLLDNYGSPTEVAIAAQQNRLVKEVEGIGPKTQEAIVQAFLVRTQGQ